MSSLPPFRNRITKSDSSQLSSERSTLLPLDRAHKTLSRPRLLEFPTDRNIGRLYIRKWEGSTSWLGGKGSRIPGFASASFLRNGWQILANAKGSVQVPTGFEVALRLNCYSVSDLSALSTLGREDLQVLILSRCPVQDEELLHLSGLTGLCALDLSETPVTDSGLSNLEGLANLRELALFDAKSLGNESLRLLRELTALEALDISRLRADGSGLRYLRDLPNLHYLGFGYSPFLSPNGLDKLGDLHHLQELHLDGANVGDEDFIYLQNLTNLQVLRLGACEAKGSGFVYLKGMNELRTLDLLMLSEFENAALAYLCHLPKLREVHLNMVSVNEEGLRHLAALPDLRVLSIDSVYDTSINKGLTYFSQKPQLEELSFYESEVDSTGVAAIGNIATLRSLDLNAKPLDDADAFHLASLSKLEKLVVWCGEGMTKTALKHLAHLVHLEELCLSHTQIDDEGLASLAGLSRLRELHISFSLVQGEGLVHLQNLRDLRRLGIGRLSRGHEHYLASLRDLPSLEALVLNSCEISDSSTRYLSGCEKLRELSLAYTPISDQALRNLRILPQLESLDLTDTDITDTGLAYLAETVERKLRHLDLWKTRVTDAAAQSLSKLTSLESLDLSDTPLTDASVESLGRLGRLEELRLWDTQMSVTGRDRLSRLIPNCVIS